MAFAHGDNELIFFEGNLFFFKRNAIYVKRCSLAAGFEQNKMTPNITHATGPLGRTVLNVRLLTLTALLMMAAGNASALDIVEWRFQTSLYTHHWSSDPEHVNNSKLLNLEFETSTRWIYGFAHFDNSFGQPSQYLYAGYSWPIMGREWAYFKVTGGLLHGYKEPYDEKIPLNELGIAPAIVPTFGFKYKRVFTEIQILGTAALTWTAGFNFGHKSD